MARKKRRPLGLAPTVNFASAKAASTGGFNLLGALKDVGEAAIDVLSAPSRAVGGTIAAAQDGGFQPGDLATGISRSFDDAYDPSDVLGTSDSFAGGLAADILLDPLTYLTGGSLAALRAGAKAGTKAAGKALVRKELQGSPKATNKVRDVVAEPLDALPSPRQRIKQSAAQQMAMPSQLPKAKPQLRQGKPQSSPGPKRPDLVQKKIDQVMASRGMTPMGGAGMVMNQQTGNMGNNLLYNPPTLKSPYQRVFPARLKTGDNVRVDGEPKVFIGNTGESRTGKLGKEDRYYFADDTPLLQKWMKTYQQDSEEYISDNLPEFVDDIVGDKLSGKLITNRIGVLGDETVDGKRLKTLTITRLNQSGPKSKTSNPSTVSKPSLSSTRSPLDEAIRKKAIKKNQQMKDFYEKRGETNLLFNPPKPAKAKLPPITQADGRNIYSFDPVKGESQAVSLQEKNGLLFHTDYESLKENIKPGDYLDIRNFPKEVGDSLRFRKVAFVKIKGIRNEDGKTQITFDGIKDKLTLDKKSRVFGHHIPREFGDALRTKTDLDNNFDPKEIYDVYG